MTLTDPFPGQLSLLDAPGGQRQTIGLGAALLRAYALDAAQELVHAIHSIAARSPFRHMSTPGGRAMSVAMTNCGPCGWTSDTRGYRYVECDPQTGAPWPAMPEVLASLAHAAAAEAGFARFAPDACLINRYQPGARLTLHQDRDEQDFAHPIVSISLGLPAEFLWGGNTRSERAARITLHHGDVVVWGGPDRLRFHGVKPLADGEHPVTGRCRYNLTLRCARADASSDL